MNRSAVSRALPSTPSSRRLNSDRSSRIRIFAQGGADCPALNNAASPALSVHCLETSPAVLRRKEQGLHCPISGMADLTGEDCDVQCERRQWTAPCPAALAGAGETRRRLPSGAEGPA